MKQALIEFVPFVFLLTLTLCVHFTDIKPFQRGFFCGDHTLKYPYIENQTIPTYVCFTLWIVISIFTILTTQMLTKSYSIKVIKDIIMGALCCILLTDTIKYTVGKLRPHFLTVCNPDYNNICFDKDAYYIDGSGDDEEELLNEFYQKYVNETNVCSLEKTEALNEARLSFLSGHASFSFYFATFLIHFMNENSKHLKWISKIVPLIQLLIILIATWISITRITDFYHHPSDVICGACTGISIAIYTRKKATTYTSEQSDGEEAPDLNDNQKNTHNTNVYSNSCK